MRRALSIALMVWLKLGAARAAELALVMAIDVSASVTPGSYILQRDGIAAAFEDPHLIDAVAGLPEGIEILVLEWSDPGAIAVTVPWMRIVDRDGALRFAAALRATTRSLHGLTGIGPGLAAAAGQFRHLPQPAARWVIDLSGDGIANIGEAPDRVRDRLAAQRITINALALPSGPQWLADYYRHHVIGGPDAFVVAVQEFRTFAAAMRRKLKLEIAGGTAGRGLAP
jgi:Ca-activated chloride channel homolog